MKNINTEHRELISFYAPLIPAARSPPKSPVVLVPTQGVTAIKLRKRCFKVPSGMAETVQILPSLTGLDRKGHVRPGNELPGYYLPSLSGL
ncbi:MAG: hypothetical protein GY749_40430 [Desulfobacteraceae bacterium]|nr:hypothetical protein [Desulfobacteraceae bacterium]